MKHLTAILLTVMLLVILVAPVATLAATEASVILTGPSVIRTGQTVEVTLHADNLMWVDAYSAEIQLSNPGAFSVTGITPGVSYTGNPIPTTWNVSNGVLYILGNMAGVENDYMTGSADLVTITLTASGGYGDICELTFSNNCAISEYSPELGEQPATWTGITLAINSCRGDANEDGALNAIDITKLERQIVGLDALSSNSDVNQDGKVNAIDITWLEMGIGGLIAL